MRRNLVLAIVGAGIVALIVALTRQKDGGAGERSRSGASARALARRSAIDDRVWPLPQAIDEAADYLSRVNASDGRFTYRQFLDGRHVSSRKYNILRHAGSIYALADYHVHTTDVAARAKADATMARASQYLLSRYVRPVPNNADLAAVWSDPKEEGGERPAAKLGGAALAIIGVVSEMATKADAGAPPPELATMQSLGRFVLFMEKPNGELRAKYDQDTGFVNDFESLYYPGEAILALTLLYEADHDARWLDGGARAIARLVESRRGTKKLPNDHWLMIATDRFLPYFGAVPSPPIAKAAIVDHAVALGQTMMDEQSRVLERVDDPDVAGAFGADARTTPTATRLEGLLAVEHAIAGEPERAAFRRELRQAIHRGIAFLRRSQVPSGPARGAIPASLKAPAALDGGDDDESEGAPEKEIRIDYVQHALSALMRYAKMCSVDPTGCPVEGTDAAGARP